MTFIHLSEFLCHAKCRSRNIGYVLLAVCLATTIVLAHMECMTRSVVAYSWTCHRCLRNKRPFNVHTSQLTWLKMEIIVSDLRLKNLKCWENHFVLSNWIFLTLIESNSRIEYSYIIQWMCLEPLINKRLQSVPSQIRLRTEKWNPVLIRDYNDSQYVLNMFMKSRFDTRSQFLDWNCHCALNMLMKSRFDTRLQFLDWSWHYVLKMLNMLK